MGFRMVRNEMLMVENKIIRRMNTKTKKVKNDIWEKKSSNEIVENEMLKK